jgi:hypothetical protein
MREAVGVCQIAPECQSEVLLIPDKELALWGIIMEFMGISVGILALICALILLFGVHGTRRILGLGLGVLLLCAAGVGAFMSAWPKLQHSAAAEPPPFDPSKPYSGGSIATATPLTILPPLPSGFELDITPDLADKVRVTGPDKRIFIFAAGTKEGEINYYLQTQFGAPGSPRAECWIKEPGPWCSYR